MSVSRVQQLFLSLSLPVVSLPPSYAASDAGNSDDEVAVGELNKALASSGAGEAKSHAATTRFTPYASVSGQERQPVVVSFHGLNHSNSCDDSNRDRDCSDSTTGLAGEGVLPQEPPVRQGSHDSEGKITQHASSAIRHT